VAEKKPNRLRGNYDSLTIQLVMGARTLNSRMSTGASDLLLPLVVTSNRAQTDPTAATMASIPHTFDGQVDASLDELETHLNSMGPDIGTGLRDTTISTPTRPRRRALSYPNVTTAENSTLLYCVSTLQAIALASFSFYWILRSFREGFQSLQTTLLLCVGPITQVGWLGWRWQSLPRRLFSSPADDAISTSSNASQQQQNLQLISLLPLLSFTLQLGLYGSVWKATRALVDSIPNWVFFSLQALRVGSIVEPYYLLASGSINSTMPGACKLTCTAAWKLLDIIQGVYALLISWGDANNVDPMLLLIWSAIAVLLFAAEWFTEWACKTFVLPPCGGVSCCLVDPSMAFNTIVYHDPCPNTSKTNLTTRVLVAPGLACWSALLAATILTKGVPDDWVD
jgi:hypothetical protein